MKTIVASRKKIRSFSLAILATIALLSISHSTLAQEARSKNTFNVISGVEEEIVVRGIRLPVVLTAQQVAGAEDEFAKWRPKLAPTARLAFRVGLIGNASREGLELRLRNEDDDIPIPSIDGKTFILPTHGQGKWAVYANREKKSLAIEPYILSSGTDEFNRRMGDLRLQCRVYWGTIRSQTSVIVRGMYGAAGGCASKRFGYYVLSSKPITSASLSATGEVKPIIVLRGRIYSPPLGDKNVDNDAVIKLR